MYSLRFLQGGAGCRVIHHSVQAGKRTSFLDMSPMWESPALSVYHARMPLCMPGVCEAELSKPAADPRQHGRLPRGHEAGKGVVGDTV